MAKCSHYHELARDGVLMIGRSFLIPLVHPTVKDIDEFFIHIISKHECMICKTIVETVGVQFKGGVENFIKSA